VLGYNAHFLEGSQNSEMSSGTRRLLPIALAISRVNWMLQNARVGEKGCAGVKE